jgi:hypothetical protein
MSTPSLVASCVAAAGNPAVAPPVRTRLLESLRTYHDVLADMLIGDKHDCEGLVERHNAAYASLARALRDAGPDAAATA